MKTIISTESYGSVIQYYDGFNREVVDLGLPSGNLWAKCNIGAMNEEEGGLYFQWGDVSGYTSEQVGKNGLQKAFTFTDYKFSIDGSSTNFSKYNSTDGKTVLDLEDDAAHVILGEEWYIPTEEDFDELCHNTDMFVVPTKGEEVPVTVSENGKFEFTPLDEPKSLKFYKKGDHSIYISAPFYGYAFNGSIESLENSSRFWSASSNGTVALCFSCSTSEGIVLILSGGRCYGHPIRAIKK